MVYEKRLTFRKGEFIHMGQVRKKEAISAMKLLGIDRRQLIFLGYPDFGTFSIFRYFWRGIKPYKSMFTRVNSVPYKDDLSYGKPYTGQSILQDFESVLTSFRPTKIFVSHPMDVNSDHKTAYLFLEIALADLSGNLPRPKIYTYLIHWKGWPLPRHYHPELSLLPPEDLRDSCLKWSKYDLSGQELEKKHKAVLCYKSQTQSSAFYLFAFARKNELIGCFPEIGLVKDNSAIAPSANRCVTYELSGDRLLIRVAKSKNSGSKLNTLIYLFGYNYKIPFERMPKIRIITRSKKFKIFDGKKRLDYKEGIVSMADNEVIISVPLALLGDPDFLLASVKKYNKEPCVDGVGFRRVILRRI
jgi:LmbE family N-acetylglucosaminyl deacetylase